MIDSPTVYQHRIITACLLATLLFGCQAVSAPSDSPPRPKIPKRVWSHDDAVSVVLPADLIVHRHHGVIHGTTQDGSFRIQVERLGVDTLARLAAHAKDAWMARGWEVVREQYYERALFVALRRGGGPRQPASQREVWWVTTEDSVVVCDVIAMPSAYDRLGEAVRAGCQTVEAMAAVTPDK